MFSRLALLASVCIACSFGPCLFGQGTTTSSTITRNYSFPPVGLGSSETAQVNVVNIAIASTAANATAPSCPGTITFTNAAGKSVGSTSFTTTGNQITSAQLTFSTLATSGNRAEFIATVQQTVTIPTTAPCSLVFSLETYSNSTYQTDVFLGNSSASMTGPVIDPVPVVGGHK